MNIKEISQSLRSLASKDKTRSKTAILRDVLDDVEIAMAAGVSQIAIVDELSRHGLDMSLPTFKSALSRLRKKRKATGTVAENLDGFKEQPDRNSQESAESTEFKKSSNPADLDKIMTSRPDLDALAKLAKRNKS